MKRLELAHILRAACEIAGDEHILVIGSQSILGTYSEEELPDRATASMEADIAFFDDAPRAKADAVEGAIGELSMFHRANGVYAEGVHIETAAYLPEGWRDRLISWSLVSSQPSTPRFLDPHDLAIAKLGANREKDLEFVDALLRADMLDLPTLRARCAMLADEHDEVRRRVDGFPGTYE